MGKNAIKKNDMDDLHDARHGPLFMLYLKKLDWTACRKVQVRHGRHDMEGLRLITCFCQLSWKPRVNERSGRGIEDQHGVDLQGPSQTFHRAMVSMTNLVWALLPFRTPSVSCHSTRLNIGSTLQRSAKVTCTLHCRTALPLGISVRFIFSFKWPPSYVKMSASWTISLREVASIESMGKNAIKKKMTWMTCMMHGMVPCSCCTSRSSTGLQVGKSRFVLVAMTWKVLRLNTCCCQLCHGNHE